jgi:Domain of unknown function (DU1801)
MMQSKAKTPELYVNSLDENERIVIEQFRKIIKINLPKGFEEIMNYGMLGYVVPHSMYPNGYHCDPKLPLPFLGLAAQKNSINFYHMGIYAEPELLNWFVSEFPKHSTRKLDMGKSCMRFKHAQDILFELIGELVSKISPEKWILMYETLYNPSTKRQVVGSKTTKTSAKPEAGGKKTAPKRVEKKVAKKSIKK